ncbi:MAG: MurR/RpiR family transcriptional regulator, partial [Bacillota bacterium]|nr:MurR/RpiR family transcriptional regulator [Bacillota bacterium]
ADHTCVSTTTVIRFAKLLGFPGFTELKQNLINNVKGNVGLPERLQQKEQLENNDLLRNTFLKEISCINQTIQTLSRDALEKAVKLTTDAGDIYVLGLRVCFSLAFLFATVLGQTRKNVRLINGIADTYPESMISATSGDVCYVFAFPRFLKDTIFLVRQLKKQGVKVILITEPSYSKILEMADVVLFTSPNDMCFKGSFVPAICLINYLISEIVNKAPESSLRVVTQIEKYLSENYI